MANSKTALHHGETSPEKDFLRLQPGRVTELVGDTGAGLTWLGLRLLAEPSLSGPVVVVDTRGWISPEAAWETGVEAESLVIVRCSERPLWTKVTAALLEGVPAVFAEVPVGIKEQDLRRLAALARARKAHAVFRPMGGRLPSGVSHLRLRSLGVTWEGADRGHGKLKRRRLVLEASGKGARGMNQQFEVEDGDRDIRQFEVEGGDRDIRQFEVEGGDRDIRQFEVEGGDENAMRLVSDVVVGPARRAVG